MTIRLCGVLAATLATGSLAIAHGGSQIAEKVNGLHGKMEQQGC